ncbi:MAG: ABC transporter ATP-binding protein [Spirochaetes bacterium]|nr:ABC transporter ATP-binding protein [Spirochaetota bacterium]
MPHLEMRGVTKRYGDLLANDAVDFSVEKDEIHAIVGENGAGKTTLMKILYGLEQPDAGTIALAGAAAVIRTPLDAARQGIGMVHQHFKLIPEFTVAQNVVLGVEPRRWGLFTDRKEARARVGEVIRSHGFGIEPDARVADLTVGQMQQVEIVKMLYRRASLLILDEPTSVLTEQEIHGLFRTLRSLQADGKTCIIITHKLHEVKEISDRVTVMRQGRVVAVRDTASVDAAELSRLMVGRSVLFQLTREARSCGSPVLELEKVSLRRRGSGRPLLDDVSLTVRSCEIVGVAGVSGNGLGELEDVVAGLRRISGGRIRHNGEDISGLSTATLRDQGLAYVPADRLHRGASLDSTVTENMIVSHHHGFLRAGFLLSGRIRRFSEGLARSFSIGGAPEAAIRTLSGGNIQKVILARELASSSNLLIVSEPTWGLDVASSQFVYEKILESRAGGAGVLLISSNLDEILGIADTVAVMYRGRIVAVLPNANGLSKELIGEYMLGLRDDFARPAAGGTEGPA